MSKVLSRDVMSLAGDCNAEYYCQIADGTI
jgi:hypothetical protein